jgi:hypothetical protein
MTLQICAGEPTPAPNAGVIDPYVQRVYEAAAKRLRTTGGEGDAALADRIERFSAACFSAPSQAGHRTSNTITEDDRPTPLEGKAHGPKPRL